VINVGPIGIGMRRPRIRGRATATTTPITKATSSITICPSRIRGQLNQRAAHRSVSRAGRLPTRPPTGSEPGEDSANHDSRQQRMSMRARQALAPRVPISRAPCTGGNRGQGPGGWLLADETPGRNRRRSRIANPGAGGVCARTRPYSGRPPMPSRCSPGTGRHRYPAAYAAEVSQPAWGSHCRRCRTSAVRGGRSTSSSTSQLARIWRT
jgi:hypothetical protein